MPRRLLAASPYFLAAIGGLMFGVARHDRGIWLTALVSLVAVGVIVPLHVRAVHKREALNLPPESREEMLARLRRVPLVGPVLVLIVRLGETITRDRAERR